MEEAFGRIEALSEQTVVHRKKFEYVLSQLRRFFDIFIQRQSNKNYPKDQKQDQTIIIHLLQDLRDLLSQNLLQNWAVSTIENKSDFVLIQLQQILKELKTHTNSICPDAASEIDTDSSQWIQYQILDLRAISASFFQYLGQIDINSKLGQSIQSRLKSIDRALCMSDPELAGNISGLPHRTFSPIPINYQSWRVSSSDFEEIKEIGSGVSATVFYGKDLRNGEPVAIKKFKLQKLNGAKLQSFQREVAALATARHPCLLRLIGATDTPPFCIITEWMPNSSLYHDLHNFHHLDATGRTIAAYDIARGMSFLHSCQIVHRDLKSLNILLDSNYRIRICDFGFSRHATEDSLMTQNIGTPHWMAPELLQTNTNYTNKVDVYAFGVVLWELATSQTPYTGIEASQIVTQVLLSDLRPPLPSDLNPGMRDLISLCWDRNPAVRPTFAEITRRLSTGDIIFNGASREEFLKYVKESATSAELRRVEIEDILVGLTGKPIEELKKISGEKGKSISRTHSFRGDNLIKEISLNEAVRRLKEGEIPSDLISECWGIIPYLIEKFGLTNIISYIALFAHTTKKNEAAQMLRNLPRGSISQEVITEFINEIPTGSEKTDTDIVITSCKAGYADLCVLYSINKSDIALALDVTAKCGVDPQLHTAVVDRCVQALGAIKIPSIPEQINQTDNPCVIDINPVDLQLAGSAIRCLMSLNESRRILVNSAFYLSNCNDPGVSATATLALAEIAASGQELPSQVTDFLFSKWKSDNRVLLALIASCKSKSRAEQIVKKFLIEEKEQGWNESIARILLQCSQFEDLKPSILEYALTLKTPSECSLSLQSAIQFLTTDINA